MSWDDDDQDDEYQPDTDEHDSSCVECDAVLCEHCSYCHKCDIEIIHSLPGEWFIRCYPNHPKLRPELQLPEGL